MNATRRICLFCGICMGIITIFLLTCGRNAPARSLGLVNFKPFMASSAFPALPTLSVPFRKQGSKRCHRSLDGSEPGSPDSPLVSGVIPIIFHPHFSRGSSFPMTRAIFPVSVKSGACCLFPLLHLPLVPPEPVSSTSRRTLLQYGYIVPDERGRQTSISGTQGAHHGSRYEGSSHQWWIFSLRPYSWSVR